MKKNKCEITIKTITTMKAIKLKTITAPKVYFSEGAVKNRNTNNHALALASKVIGMVVLKVTNNTGFTDEQNGLFAHYDKSGKYLMVQTMDEMADGLIIPERV
jgi:hypothetical protein